MRPDTIPFRLASLMAISGLCAGALPGFAHAQALPANPPLAGASGPAVTPPALVGALVRVTGSVSFHAPGAEEWSAAPLNYPVTSGEGLWTQPDARARVSIGDAVLEMNGSTDLEVSSLDANGFVATLPQGEIYLHVRSLFPGQTFSVVTPRGAATIASPGRYNLVAGTTDTPTVITALEGAAALSEGASGTISAGQSAVITGDQQPFQAQIQPAVHDAFLDQALARERRPAAAAVPPLVADMPGGEELSEYGTWSQSPEYGEVWYPQVSSGWVPYREGHWAYVPPWGWTWVDDDPWGFAPFHYGRWIDIGGRWAWTPGESAPAAEAPPYPVYAPALVTFFGIGAAVGVTAAMLSSGSVGWVPLGPHEVYRPWFHAPPAYIREVNIRHVTNISQINTVIHNTTINQITVNQFRNAGAATVVPAAVMATSQPVRAAAHTLPPQTLAQARPVLGHQPVPPTTATLGVTPAVARTFHAVSPPAGVAVPHRAPAPGPAIHQGARPMIGKPGAPPPVPPATATAHPPAPAPAQPPHGAAPALPAQHPHEAATAPKPPHPATATHAEPAHPAGPAAHPASPPPPAHAEPAHPAAPPAPPHHPPAQPRAEAHPPAPAHPSPHPATPAMPHPQPPAVHPQAQAAPSPHAPTPAPHPAAPPAVHAAPPPAQHAPAPPRPAPPPATHAPAAEHHGPEPQKRPGQH